MTIQEILEAHLGSEWIEWKHSQCQCGHKFEGEYNSTTRRAHVAEVLEKHMQEARAQELETAAAEYGEIYNQPQPNYYAPGHVIRALINRANEIRKAATNGR